MSKKSERPSSGNRQMKASNVSLLDTVDAFLRIIRRQLPIIIGSIALTAAIGLIYAATASRSYTAAALLIADLKRLQLSQSFGEAAIDPVELESTVEIFKSESVLLPVVKSLRLAERPEFRAVGSLQKLTGTATPVTEQVATRRALEALRLSLGVARVGRTRVIEISYKDSDPNFAALVVNTLADSYIADQLEAKSEAARQASVWLQARIDDLARQAAAQEQAVVQFKSDNNIIDAGGRLMNEQQLAEIASKLGNARAATADARVKLERLQSILEKDRKDPNSNETVADTLKNEVVSNLRTRYLTLSNREADYTARYGADHLAVVNLRSQLLGIRRSIHEELQRLEESYKSDLAIAGSKQNEIEKEYTTSIANLQVTSRAQVKLRELEGAARTARALYDHFVERNMEQIQQQSMRFSDTRLISPASAPLAPSQPKRLQAIVIAVLGGATLGVGLATLRDTTDRAFRTSEQVEKRLTTKCLALAPLLQNADPALPAEDDTWSRRTRAGARHEPWSAVIDAPYSRYAEEIHAVRLAAGLDGSTKSCKVIGVTSTFPGEGKTTTAVNLARLVARNGGTAALVDCDLRNPLLSRIFAVGERAGLSEVIVHNATLGETMRKDALTDLMVLSAGDDPRFAHPGDILASQAIGGLFERLRQLYEWVIVDLPPMGPVTDVRSTTAFIDSYLLVIEWGRTDCACVEQALEKEPDVYERLIGAVLNKVDVGRLPNYGGKHLAQMNRYYNSLTSRSESARAA